MTVRKFHTKYRRNSDLISSTLKREIKKCRQSGSVGVAKHTGRLKESRAKGNVEAERESVGESSETSYL